MGEWCNEGLEVGPREQPKALEVQDANGDTRSVLVGESQDLFGGPGSDPRSSHDGEGAETGSSRAARLENRLSQERDQTIGPPLRTDL